MEIPVKVQAVPLPETAQREKVKLEGPKITGKIDLPEPPKKTKAAKEKEAEEVKKPAKGKKAPANKEVEKPVIEETSPEAATPEKTKEDFVPTKFSKLEGPTIIGKIDLPQKPIASSNTDSAPKGGGTGKKKEKDI